MARVVPLGVTTVPLAESLGWVLATDIVADRDLPAFPKAMMDGIAVRSDECRPGGATWRVVGEIAAGHPTLARLGPGEAVRIMTGAAVPADADAVIPIERCEFVEERVTSREVARPGQHVQPVGRELKAGKRVIPAGVRITPAVIGLLATVGAVAVRVYRKPEVAVITTGDEVVEPDCDPGPWQLRNSNGPMLVAQATQAGARPHYLGIAGDDRNRLESLIEEALTRDVVILSGGVSTGQRDLVPDVVKSLGVERHFHKVAMKPGKPLLFGTRGATLVFGLPGNPVSSFAGFELFVRPALRGLSGERDLNELPLALPLAEPIRVRGDRPTYHPARTEPGAMGETVRPLAWSGSPDLKGLVDANAFAVFPAGDVEYAAGQRVGVIRYRD